MATLSTDQIRNLLVAAGFKKDSPDTQIMVAIAYAESGGNPASHNDNPSTGDESYGLWQINMIGSLGPARRKAFGITSNSQLFDPATNARAAKYIYDHSGLKAWTTYTRGTYLKFMDKTTTAEGGNQSPADKLSGIADSGIGQAVTGGLNAFGDTLFKAASNVVGIIVAIVLLILGIVLLSRNQIPVVKAVKKVAG